ncbi:AraC family transcriptional regulator [Pseudoalteromonas piscicida]|uniref:AraC family transcriptional regulator n=1 Tax=Pseudoalteromonas piscicida TaxID=43662 RepID=A0A2A5JV01_PSEO7|nr:helix-turn-helix domain-containing protein [Pseudoalteromonas piscicida]PCK33177.1 AraC family transcriptional regulator [Pseudoalteromonas piscicida]
MPPSARHTSNSEAVYLQRLTPVLEWVHAHPALPLSLQQAAGLSHFSKFHFQRIFTAVIGESLSQYSNRVRLEGAANRLLLAEHDSVTEIALRYGFSGSANFSRAFKEHFGVTPSSVRKTEQLKKLVATSHIEPALNTTQLTRIHSLRAKSKETIQPVKVIEVPEQLLCTLRATKGYQLDGINDCWQRLASWADEQGINYLQVPKFGFGHDNPVFTPMDKARYDGAIVITEKQKSAVTAPYKLTRLSPGTYAIFGYRGTIKNLLSFQLDIFAQWLPHSGYEPTNMPLVEHYPEVLEEQHGKPPSEHFIVLEIWLQVQPLRDTHQRFE